MADQIASRDETCVIHPPLRFTINVVGGAKMKGIETRLHLPTQLPLQLYEAVLNYLVLLSLFIFSAITGVFSWAFLEPQYFL
jgi:prolipoprotein diacylglyceryltransferase